jgi:hypothetical protein
VSHRGCCPQQDVGAIWQQLPQARIRESLPCSLSRSCTGMEPHMVCASITLASPCLPSSTLLSLFCNFR